MKKALYKSLTLHLVVAVLITIQIPLFWLNKKTTISQVPIIVDLKDIKISEMTNLPPKAKIDKEDKAASTIKRKMNENYTTPEPKKEEPAPKTKEEPKAEESKTVDDGKDVPIKQDFLEAPDSGKKKTAMKPPAKPSKKPKPPAQKADAKAKADDKNKPELANPLKSLLASVDSLEKILVQPTSKPQ